MPVICGDCLDVMRQIPDGFFDLVVTSPPYNLCAQSAHWSHSSGKWKVAALAEGYDGFDDCLPEDEYVEWQRNCLTEMLRLVNERGAVFYNHKWRVQNGLLDDRRAIVDGFPLRQVLIWSRPGGMNFNRSFFLPTYEVIYVFAKPKFRLVPKACGYSDVWRMAPAKNNSHPAPFPLELPKRIIASTYARRVLDPFCGSGTTGVAAKQLNVKFLGIEKSPKYADMAREACA